MSLANGSLMDQNLKRLLKGGAYKPRKDASRHCDISIPTLCKKCVRYKEGPYDFGENDEVLNPPYYFRYLHKMTPMQKFLLKRYNGNYNYDDIVNYIEEPEEEEEKNPMRGEDPNRPSTYGYEYEEEQPELKTPIQEVTRSGIRSNPPVFSPRPIIKQVPRSSSSRSPGNVRFSSSPEEEEQTEELIRRLREASPEPVRRRRRGTGICKKCKKLGYK
jgi:hypothetical protein